MNRSWAVGVLATLIAIAVLSLAAVFGQSDQVRRVAGHGKVIQASEELISASVAHRGALAVGILMTEATSRGYASEEQRAVTIDDIRATASRLLTLSASLDQLTEDAHSIEPMARSVFDEASRVADLLEAGDAASTDAVVSTLVSDIERLHTAVSNVRTDAFALVIAEEGSAGSLARATSVAIGVLLPGLALIVYRRLNARRQQRIQLELELKHEQEQVRIKDEMIGNLSHELRTPLAAVLGAALTLQDGVDHDPDLQMELTEMIVSESSELSRMVDDLLVIAKIEAGDLEVALDDVDVTRQVEAAITPYGGFERFVVDCEEGVVSADRLRLRHAIQNLVSNAVQHGGERIAIVGRESEGRYLLAVHDDGPGVPESMVPQLFERYVHDGDTPLVTGTVGLGLAVAKILTERMGGCLTYARSGGITTFSMDLAIQIPGSDSYAGSTTGRADAIG